MGKSVGKLALPLNPFYIMVKLYCISACLRDSHFNYLKTSAIPSEEQPIITVDQKQNYSGIGRTSPFICPKGV